jgi:hypothetical protein
MLGISSAPIKQHEASQKTAAKSPLLHSTAGSARHITPAASLKLNLTIVSDPRCKRPCKIKCLLLRCDVVPSPLRQEHHKHPTAQKGLAHTLGKNPPWRGSQAWDISWSHLLSRFRVDASKSRPSPVKLGMGRMQQWVSGNTLTSQGCTCENPSPGKVATVHLPI